MISEDERGATAVRTLLGRIDAPPSHVDVDLALQTGRRGERRRQILTVAAVAVSVVVSGAVAVGIGGGHPQGREPQEPAAPVEATAVSCTVTEFARLPGHSVVRMYAGDPTGRYQIGTAFNDARQKIRAVLWVDGAATVFDVPGSGVFTDPTDVTSAGVVVGTASGVRDGGAFAWRYHAGKVTKLPNPPGYTATGKAVINERGDVAAVASGPGQSAVVVVVWWPGASPNQPRVLAAEKRPEVYGISDDGTVVGLVTDADFGTAYIGTPYIWSPDGVGRALAVPSTWDYGVLMGVHGDWAFGSVHKRPASTGQPAEGQRVVWTLAPARWQLSTGEVRVWTGPMPDGVLNNATESGWLSAAWEGGAVLIAPDGRALRLVDRDPDGAELGQAAWVSDDGRTVVGEGWYPERRTDGTIPATWRCD